MSLEYSSRSRDLELCRKTIPDATTEKRSVPDLSLVRLTMRLLLLDDRNDGRDGSLAAGVSRSMMQAGT